MAYRHIFADGRAADVPLGKVVCVGRNYADHARELNNAVPEQPLLFLKPASAVIPFGDTLNIPRRFANPHYETEMTVLIGRDLCCCTEVEALKAIAGLGVGLDLTLREVQNQLKDKGYPWERAKAFDGSCVLSPFAPFIEGIELQNLAVRLWRNGESAQDGNTGQMLFPVLGLLCEISQTFSLQPGDVVMTGTPKGVGQLENGDLLRAELDNLVSVQSRVAFVFV
jgi:2-keto-4-pentenoate hydratase/2-oxohepta-3-ene-1,7-dioic acid hydratase in catechol pathway